MNRDIFINKLFNNGEGLTLSQIEKVIVNYIPSTIPDGLIEELEASDEEITHEIAVDMANEAAYENFIMDIQDCADLLELHEFLNNIVNDVTDEQVYILRYCATLEDDDISGLTWRK